MATYKKRGAKKTQSPKGSQAVESKTEEVFSNLDTGATRLEQWIAVYQRQIFGLIFGVILIVLGYLGYQSLILDPKIAELKSELETVKAELDAKPTIEKLQDARNGSIVINVSNEEVTISFNIEESDDLKTWKVTGEKITKTIQLKSGKKFYRFALD